MDDELILINFALLPDPFSGFYARDTSYPIILIQNFTTQWPTMKVDILRMCTYHIQKFIVFRSCFHPIFCFRLTRIVVWWFGIIIITLLDCYFIPFSFAVPVSRIFYSVFPSFFLLTLLILLPPIFHNRFSSNITFNISFVINLLKPTGYVTH